jgi:hypothetical protein
MTRNGASQHIAPWQEHLVTTFGTVTLDGAVDETLVLDLSNYLMKDC